jgi:E3 ubiquitin-protein ligase RNF144
MVEQGWPAFFRSQQDLLCNLITKLLCAFGDCTLLASPTKAQFESVDLVISSNTNCIAVNYLTTTILASTMDPETAKVAVELQIADINGLFDGLYDKADIPNGDARTSFQIMRKDLEQQLQILEGQLLLLKILREEHEGRVAFSRLLEEEKQAISDHQLSMELAGGAVSDPDFKQCSDDETTLCGAPECGSDEQWDMARELYAAAFDRQPTDRASLHRIRTAEAGNVKGKTKAMILGSDVLTKCCACMEVVSSKNTLTLECKPEVHTYCRVCLIDLFTSALDNTSLFPPRCCRLPIPLDTCRAILPKELVKSFDIKVEELATPNPTYCSNAECSKFLRSKDIKAEVGTCVFCKHKTCLRCKGSDHEGLCPSDPHVQLLMDVARRSRWQQCTKCNNMVELEQGCFHMTLVSASL